MRFVAALLAAVLLAGCSTPHYGPRGAPLMHPEALLRASPLSDLVIDVDFMTGAEPTASSMETGFAALRAVVDKRTITVEPPTRIAGTPRTYNFADLLALAMAGRDVTGPPFGSDGTARLHIIYARGEYPGEEGSTLAGLYERFTGTVFVFPDAWRSSPDAVLAMASTGIPPEFIEAEVLTHELGHALGLVNLGVPMLVPRLAPSDSCRCHSREPDSVMAPSVHNVLQHLQSIADRRVYGPMGFDGDDLADLAAFREGRTGPPLR